MPPRKSSNADHVALILANAKGLRDAGVLAVELDGVSFTLAPPDPPEGQEQPKQVIPSDPLHDPALYGRSDGTTPGFGAPTDED